MIIRKPYLQQLLNYENTEFIKVITGIRRAGKSVLMQQYGEYLINKGIKKENIFYLNFEDMSFSHLLNAQALFDHFKVGINTQEKVYFLLDEVQLVEDWQVVVNSLRVSFNSDITITGSNAKMLSGELATNLSGRYVEIKVYPLSFKEFVAFSEIDTNDALAVQQALKPYMHYGGFPAVVLSNEGIKDSIIGGIYDTVLLNDVAYRAAVREPVALKLLTNFLAANVGQQSSANNIANTLSVGKLKVSAPTISSYLRMLEDAFLIYQAQRYDIRGKEILRTNNKYYFADLGLRRLALSGRSSGAGGDLENLVYLELIRRGYQVDVGQLQGGEEVDFVARRLNKVLYVQVTYEIPANSNRETDNLLKIRDQYEKILITQRAYEYTEIDGVPVINIVDWLMQADEAQ
ncbi:MAG: ATP-binding protein [Lactobacillaceae bacterium]|jgi:predicted AAA+ superfamily ATPase|nr:ATP-binding protein [Lactobacillaceae bacterium]